MTPFDAAVLQNPDDVDTWAVFADWLEERGDPRAELMRLMPPGVTFPSTSPLDPRIAAVIDAHAPTWFPGLRLAELHLTWRHGFVHAAQVTRRAMGDLSPEDFFALPSLRFIQHLTVVGDGLTRALAALPGLRHLTLLSVRGPELRWLDDVTLPAVENLNLPRCELGGDGPWRVSLPSLKTLQGPGHLVVALQTTSAARTATVTLDGPRDVAAMEQLRGAKPRGFVDGVGLSERQLDELRARWPDAAASASVREESNSFHWSRRPSASEQPRHAPPDFHRLPRWVIEERPTPQSSSPRTVAYGAGIPMNEAGSLWHSRCVACASGDVHCVYLMQSELYSRFETTHYETAELHCQRCGAFTAYAATYES